MSIPILAPDEVLSADLLDAEEWSEYGTTNGPYDFQVPPVPHPWAFSAFQRALHFGEGSGAIRLGADLREPIPAGVKVKLMCWAYRISGGRGGQLFIGGTADMHYPPDEDWQPGWNLLHAVMTTQSQRANVRIARLGVPTGHTWWSGLTVMRQADSTPELEQMIQAQADAGRLI